MNSELAAVQMDQVDFKAEKQRLVAIKTSLQARLSEINAACKTRLPTREFQKLQSERGQLSAQVSKVEGELSQVNQRLAEANAVLTSTTAKKNVSVALVRELVAIRDKYHELSFDTKRIPPVRRMAFNVSQEIRAALKPYFESDGNPQ